MTFFTRDTLEGFARASCSRFPKKFPVTSQKVSQKFLKKNQKLLFVTKVAQKLLKKTKNLFLLLSFFI